MSMAVAHFAVGMMATAILLTIVAPRLLHSPLILFLGGLWGLLPDSQHVLPVGVDLVHAVHVSPWANIFWFHHYLDQADPTDSGTFAAALGVCLLAVVLSCELYARTQASATRNQPTERRLE